MRDARVLVIGGGFAGIAAASRLRTHGARVMLIDDRASLGGRARSDVLDGWTVDVGAQLLATSYTRTLALLRGGDAAHAAALRKMPGRDVFLRDGTAYPITFGSLRSLLAFGAIGAADKVRLGMQLVPLLARHRNALRASGERIPDAIDRESAAGFMRRTVSRQAAAALVDPVAATFCGARGDDVSLAFYLTLGHYGSEGDVLAPERGWTALLEQAAAGVDVTHETRAVSIAAVGERLVVRSADGRTWEADGAVLATDAQSAAALLEEIADAALLDWLRGVSYRPSITVAATVGVPLPRDAFGILVHNDGRWPVSALAVHGAKADGAARERDLVLAWPTPDETDRLIHRPAAEIGATIAPAIEGLLPRAAGQLGHVRVYRHPLGTPLPHPGFIADRAAGRALARGLRAPIALAGDYLTMPLIEGAVASGQSAAEWLRDRLR
jgi:oxygen-dependent protoporphyrinogen oxidase